MGLWSSLLASTLANVLTGFCCALGPFAVGLHIAFAGSQLNPNPLMNAVVLLVGFAVPSALFEALVWQALASRVKSPRSGCAAAASSSLLAHLIGIPLALCILLIPAQPYRGLETITRHQRLWRINDEVRHSLARVIGEEGRIPSITEPEELAKLLPRGPRETSWAIFYDPEFGRFDTGETRRRPWLWNRSLSGKKLNTNSQWEDWRWLLRSPGPAARGLAVDMTTGEVRRWTQADGVGSSWP